MTEFDFSKAPTEFLKEQLEKAYTKRAELYDEVIAIKKELRKRHELKE